MTDAFVASLAAALDGQVAADGATLAAYSTDASNHRVMPRCVVFPRRTEDVVAVVTQCGAGGVSVTSRGAGTGLAGSALGSGVVLDYSRFFNRIVGVDAEARQAVVEPGVVLDSLQRRGAGLGLRFGPDPATHASCTLGGMIGTNACGARALAWGTTSANVAALDVVLADGSTATLSAGGSSALDAALSAVGARWSGPIGAELGRFSRQVSGYGLQHLLPGPGFDPAKGFVGSEGTWAQVVRATVDLVDLPPARALVLAGFGDLIAAAAAAPSIARLDPLTVEGMGADLVQAFDTSAGPRANRPALPAGSAWLLIEVGGSAPDCPGLARAVEMAAAEAGALETRVVVPAAEQRGLWGTTGAGHRPCLARGHRAEFLHHHYRHRLRPRSHLSMGWLPVWLAAGRRLPRLANALVTSARWSAAVKRLAGIDAHRDLPALAGDPVRRSGAGVRRSSARGRSSPTAASRVVVWLDTFTCTFSPSVVADAVAVLQAAGHAVDFAGAPVLRVDLVVDRTARRRPGGTRANHRQPRRRG